MSAKRCDLVATTMLSGSSVTRRPNSRAVVPRDSAAASAASATRCRTGPRIENRLLEW
jgi:hypothetical protein